MFCLQAFDQRPSTPVFVDSAKKRGTACPSLTMSNEHHTVADLATNTTAGAIPIDVARHAESHTSPQHGSAAGQGPPAAPSEHVSDGRPARAPPGLLAQATTPPRASAPERRRRARSSSPARAHGDFSRSPRGSAAAATRVPDSPDWHEAKPGPTCSIEELRFWTIREVGQLQESARATGAHIAWLLNEVKAVKASKAEAARAYSRLQGSENPPRAV